MPECGGTPARGAVTVGGVAMRAEIGKHGCGAEVKRWVVSRTPAPSGTGRPTFARTLPVTVCPVCDAPTPLDGRGAE